MDPKDYAMGEADHYEYAYRLPLYSTMELFIETLTGTCFDLRVSPYETVISVKAKIQRLEGIPVTQQYLIWQNTELEDDYCLHDYNITDGCTLKLVLAMRGGPINTRRVAMEEPGLREMADYVKSNSDELFDKLSSPPSGENSNKQVTLLVYRDGDQLNFFRVVDRGDGTLTPFTESLSGSTCNLREDEDDVTDDLTIGGQLLGSGGRESLSVAQMVENNITASKMKLLKNHMQNLSVSAVNEGKNFKALNSTPSDIKPFLKTKDSTKATSSENSNLIIPKRYFPKPPNKPKPNLNETKSQNNSEDSRIARLKRLKLLSNKEVNNENVATEITEKKLENEKSVDLASAEQEIVKPDPGTGEKDGSGRFSPRTRRLLDILEKTPTPRKPKRLPPTPASSSQKLLPCPTSVLQGMTFNRHDMYLRSYGLLSSPDQDAASDLPDPTPQREVEETQTRVYQTSQGVKYSSLGLNHPSHYWGAAGSFLKTPPTKFTPQKSSRVPETDYNPGWQPAKKPQNKDDPDSMKPVHSGRGVFGYSLRQSNDTIPVLPSVVPPKTEQDLSRKSDPRRALQSPGHPRHKHLRRLSVTTPAPEGEQSWKSEENLSNTERFYRQSSKPTSKDKSHNKVESMSRQEARDVVNFINKAVDASILRNLVRSPIKNGERGTSGNSSSRLSGPSYRTNSDTNRKIMQPPKVPHSGKRRPPSGTLPPIKPTSKKKRCFVCAKKTGLATSYTCRCGNNFCATHRYSETHDCSYDYKTTGRKLLEEANPLISAPKLPKI